MGLVLRRTPRINWILHNPWPKVLGLPILLDQAENSRTYLATAQSLSPKPFLERIRYIIAIRTGPPSEILASLPCGDGPT
jgi:hypothetical protein